MRCGDRGVWANGVVGSLVSPALKTHLALSLVWHPVFPKRSRGKEGREKTYVVCDRKIYSLHHFLYLIFLKNTFSPSFSIPHFSCLFILSIIFYTFNQSKINLVESFYNYFVFCVILCRKDECQHHEKRSSVIYHNSHMDYKYVQYLWMFKADALDNISMVDTHTHTHIILFIFPPITGRRPLTWRGCKIQNKAVISLRWPSRLHQGKTPWHRSCIVQRKRTLLCWKPEWTWIIHLRKQCCSHFEASACVCGYQAHAHAV